MLGLLGILLRVLHLGRSYTVTNSGARNETVTAWLAIVAVLLGLGCPSPPSRRTLVVGLVAEPVNLDPRR